MDFFVCSAEGDSVTQPKDETGLEGSSVTLSCRYETTALASQQYLFWYQQKPNGFPKYILQKPDFGQDNGPGFKGRFNATLNTDTKTVNLMIQDLQVSDSAVYYSDKERGTSESVAEAFRVYPCTIMAHWLWELLLLSVCFSECRSQDTVDRTESVKMALEGKTTTLKCTYKTSGTPTLFWYQQKANDFPRYMVKVFRSGSGSDYEADEVYKRRFHAELNDSSVSLTIQDLQVSDTAVYYCALRPTVTAAHSALIQKLSDLTV
ncbi:uncharacterized protein LOC134099398 [Sardina pilchardus]|uniref:uncharacterized protein LOC134099398 n=1 Tax=Sardina pilchardus TaxID=27697 RepID=UPI002E0F927D